MICDSDANLNCTQMTENENTSFCHKYLFFLFSPTPLPLLALPLSITSQIFCGAVSSCGSHVALFSGACLWSGSFTEVDAHILSLRFFVFPTGTQFVRRNFLGGFPRFFRLGFQLLHCYWDSIFCTALGIPSVAALKTQNMFPDFCEMLNSYLKKCYFLYKYLQNVIGIAGIQIPANCQRSMNIPKIFREKPREE